MGHPSSHAVYDVSDRLHAFVYRGGLCRSNLPLSRSGPSPHLEISQENACLFSGTQIIPFILGDILFGAKDTTYPPTRLNISNTFAVGEPPHM